MEKSIFNRIKAPFLNGPVLLINIPTALVIQCIFEWKFIKTLIERKIFFSSNNKKLNEICLKQIKNRQKGQKKLQAMVEISKFNVKLKII